LTERFIRIAAVLTLVAIGGHLSGCATKSHWRNAAINYPVDIQWKDTRWCVPLALRATLARVSQRFGTVTVYSTHRWPLENRKKGGKKKSYHLRCRAVDFAVAGDPASVVEYLTRQKEVGGYRHYRQGFFHIDNGPRRTW
jgi:hypothetical protein